MRLLDISVSLIGLIVTSPLMLVIAIGVKCSSPGPVLFRALRVGQDGRLFHLYKFRTMVADAATRGPRVTGQGDARITRIGRLLRQTKLDELPQLVNTLLGDMSLVGPRPEDPLYVRAYSKEQRRVLKVKPGITSAATVLHRHEEHMLNGSDWERTYIEEVLPAKLAIELEYLSRRTFRADMLILAQTATALFARPPQPGADRGFPCRS